MQIAVLGTGVVGRTLAEAFADRGHQVTIGTRDVDATMARTEPDAMGNPPFAVWAAEHTAVPLAAYADAAAGAEVVVNATSGLGSLDALRAAGDLAGTVILDAANALDFSQGFPPTLGVANTDSLGEQIQRAFPEARVVKTLNTVTAGVMVNPAAVPGEHHMFVAGDDADAKRVVVSLLAELGWPESSVLDLGGIRSARPMEMYLPLWLSLMGNLGTAMFNVRVVHG
jgi:predicted dinucleotide-binding enzyme